MFGWFRKRNNQEQQAPRAAEQRAPLQESADTIPQPLPAASGVSESRDRLTDTATAEPTVTCYDSPTGPAVEAPTSEVAMPHQQITQDTRPSETGDAIVRVTETDTANDRSVEQALPLPATTDRHALVPAPSARPAMPLSAHPNFVGFDFAPLPAEPPRMLQPKAALSDEAQHELYRLFNDMFGPAGRYRLEWRTDRAIGDDAMFAEMMTHDLVRRVQNAVADAAQLERPAPLRAITAADTHTDSDDANAANASTDTSPADKTSNDKSEAA